MVRALLLVLLVESSLAVAGPLGIDQVRPDEKVWTGLGGMRSRRYSLTTLKKSPANHQSQERSTFSAPVKTSSFSCPGPWVRARSARC